MLWLRGSNVFCAIGAAFEASFAIVTQTPTTNTREQNKDNTDQETDQKRSEHGTTSSMCERDERESDDGGGGDDGYIGN
jgi:hypothetical protein